MFDYLYKFNNLDDKIKSSVSSPEVLLLIENLEGLYGISLASVVMRVMTKDIDVNNLSLILSSELKLDQSKSEELSQELKEKIFSEVADYLGLPPVEKKKENLKKVVLPESIFDFSTPIKEEELSFVEEASFNQTKPEIVKEDTPSVEIKTIDKLTWAKEISAELNLPFPDEDTKIRFVALLDKYIRGIKDKIAVREILGKAILNNGFAFSDKAIDDIFLAVDKKQNEKMMELKGKISVDRNVLHKIEKLGHGQIKALPQKEDYSFIDNKKKLIEAPEEIELIESPEDIDLIEAPEKTLLLNKVEKEGEVDSEFETESMDILIQALLAKPQPQIKPIVSKEVKEKIVEPVEVKKIPENNKEKVLLDAKKSPSVLPKISSSESDTKLSPTQIPKSSWAVLPGGKIKMDDIKRVKTMGPVDELTYMNLADFHRLSDDPQEIFEKISQKLSILENIDYGKMLEGVKAWRKNSINKLYLNIFAQAGNEGKSVEQIIKERQSAGKEYLSLEEIKHLIKFNKKISF